MCIYVDVFVVSSGSKEIHGIKNYRENFQKSHFSFSKISLQIRTITLLFLYFSCELAVSAEKRNDVREHHNSGLRHKALGLSRNHMYLTKTEQIIGK